jgi:hypothetical protein
LPKTDLEARLFDVLSWARLRADNPAAALDAIEQACRIAPSKDRGIQRATILCDHFPDRQQETFAAANKSAEIDGREEDHRAAGPCRMCDVTRAQA